MDYISNLITAIRNAELASHASLTVPDSKMGINILAILQKHGFIQDFRPDRVDDKSVIQITLIQPLVLHHYKRVSKPGRRVYTDVKGIPIVLRGLGIVILSTPEGVIAGQEAKKKKLGGEILCEVY